MGKDDPSDNIILRNLDFEARDDGDRIILIFWSSRQVWIDHINFNNTISYNRKGDGSDGVGKFIWINTPYANKPDGKDIDRSPDYITYHIANLQINFGVSPMELKILKQLEIEQLYYIIGGIRM